jgi:hypothetical protein
MLHHLYIQVPQAPIKHKPGTMKTIFMCLRQNLCAFWEPNPDPPSSSHIFYSLLWPVSLLKEQYAVLLMVEPSIFVVSLLKNQQMLQCESMIYWCIPNFTPTCFSKSLPLSGGRIYLRSYPSNVWSVDVCGLWIVQCGQLSRDATLGCIPRQQGNESLFMCGASFCFFPLSPPANW